MRIRLIMSRRTRGRAEPQQGSQAGSQQETGAQHDTGSQQDTGALHGLQLCRRPMNERSPPKRGPQEGAQQSISQPQLGATSQPQLGAASQQPPRLKIPAKAVELKQLKAIATRAGAIIRRIISLQKSVKVGLVNTCRWPWSFLRIVQPASRLDFFAERQNLKPAFRQSRDELLNLVVTSTGRIAQS